ncbi:MAG: general secretion pathway protein GspK [Methyloprofundus sp.]|nr:general secretion pathway protein GspK [Methyloprofundus sp.]
MMNSRGLALIVVLWVITLLTIMASSFSLTIQRETAITSGLKERAEGRALAEAGINYAILMLLTTNKELRWQAFGSLYDIEYAGKKVRIQISDESGKLNINLATQEQLLQLFNSFAIEQELADSLVDAIMDWRDKNDLHRPNGAEKQQYAVADLKYEPRNGAFKSIEELQLVMGMNAKIYQQMEGMVSIYTKNKQINPTTASRAMLLTLPDASEEQVNEYLQQRVDNERNGESVVQPDWFKGSATKSNIYMIISEAMIDKNITEKIMAVIKKTRSKNGLPFEIVKWSTDYQVASLFLEANDERIVN